MELIPRIVRHYGEPFADDSAIPSFYLAEMARRHVTVALNGDGGDESFARLHALRRQRGLGAAASASRSRCAGRSRPPGLRVPESGTHRLVAAAASAAWRRRSRSTAPSATSPT